MGLATLVAALAQGRRRSITVPMLVPALARVPEDRPVVLVGEYDCAYTTAFDWPGRVEWKLVPPSRSGSRPEIQVIDPHTFVARSTSGFAMPVKEVRPSPSWDQPVYQAAVRHVARPVEAVTRGRQKLDGAWVDVIGRDDLAVYALRFRLDRPVAQYAFMFAAGCDVMEVMVGGEVRLGLR